MSAKVEVVAAFSGRLSGVVLFRENIFFQPIKNPIYPDAPRGYIIHSALKSARPRKKDLIRMSRFIQDPEHPAFKK